MPTSSHFASVPIMTVSLDEKNSRVIAQECISEFREKIFGFALNLAMTWKRSYLLFHVIARK